MIRTITLSLLALIFFGSCASKFSIVKRKYSRGYYIASSKGHHTTQKHSVAAATKKVSAPAEKINVEQLAEHKNTAAPVVKPQTHTPVMPAPAIQAGKVGSSKHVSASASKNDAPVYTRSKTVFKPLRISNHATLVAAKGESGAKFIVLVILCFFWWLNLISVYVHDGNSITANFWVTLLLDIIVIGGIIFSLLVVLDVVDLS